MVLSALGTSQLASLLWERKLVSDPHDRRLCLCPHRHQNGYRTTLIKKWMAVAIKSRPKDPKKKWSPRNGFVSTEWLPFYGMVHYFPFGCHQPGVDSLRPRSGICWPWIQWKALHHMGKPKAWLNKFCHFLISLGNPYILFIHLKPIHLLLLERIACGTAIFWTFTEDGSRASTGYYGPITFQVLQTNQKETT